MPAGTQLVPTIVRLSPADRQKLEAVRLKHDGETLSTTLRRAVRETIDWHLFGRHPAGGARPSFVANCEDGAEPNVPGSELGA